MNIAAYAFLLGAIASEVVATSLLKSTAGFTRLLPTVACLLGYGVAFYFLSKAVAYIPVGVAYALWSALGTAAVVAIGVVFLGEQLTWARVVGVGLIIAGVVVVNLSASEQTAHLAAPITDPTVTEQASADGTI